MDTKRTLYYIPILPLHRLIASGKNKKASELLLSVCAYLYHCAGVPHYRDDESFLNYHYEVMMDELGNDWNELDEADKDRNKSALRYAQHFGDIMQRRVHNPCHLEKMEERITRFNPKNDFEKDCLKVAKQTLHLSQEYPKGHLFANANGIGGEDEDEDYYGEGNNCIDLSEYVGFIGDIKGGIYDSIMEWINCDFNERPYMQEPSIITCFDTRFQGLSNLDYEHCLFDLINNLIYILEDLP